MRALRLGSSSMAATFAGMPPVRVLVRLAAFPVVTWTPKIDATGGALLVLAASEGREAVSAARAGRRYGVSGTVGRMITVGGCSGREVARLPRDRGGRHG